MIEGIRGPRLTKCRRLRHGLSRTPPVHSDEVRGDRALLPCPRAGEGSCPYRARYRCHDVVQGASRNAGVCLIEKIRRQHYLDGYLRDLSFDPEAQAPEYFRKVAALAAEARIYWERAVAYQAVMFGEEAPEPNRRSILRYFLAGALAYKRRRDLVRFLAPYRREERRQRAVAVEAVRDLRARYGQTDPTDQSN